MIHIIILIFAYNLYATWQPAADWQIRIYVADLVVITLNFDIDEYYKVTKNGVNELHMITICTYVTGFGKTDHLHSFIVLENKFEKFTELAITWPQLVVEAWDLQWKSSMFLAQVERPNHC